ncbi:hypothetical protein, partial [Aeromonas veronii]|uniref:hypothetical protein n=1 Tax=Aeromonas veronii TaxID=654 RepID=UPI00226D0DB0
PKLSLFLSACRNSWLPTPLRLFISCFFKVSSGPACWRGFFMSDASLLMVAVKKINGVNAPYGTFLVHKWVVGTKFLMMK